MNKHLSISTVSDETEVCLLGTNHVFDNYYAYPITCSAASNLINCLKHEFGNYAGKFAITEITVVTLNNFYV